MSVFVPHIEVLAFISGRLLTKRSRFSNSAKFGYDARSRIEDRKMDTKAFQNRCVEKDVTVMNLHNNSVVLSAFLASFSFLDPWGISRAGSQRQKYNSRGAQHISYCYIGYHYPRELKTGSSVAASGVIERRWYSSIPAFYDCSG